jgi:hypothetical protein
VLKPQAAAMAGPTSAAHVLALLDEDEDSLKLYALQQLDRSVHDFWFQISSSIAAIEALYEDEEFSHRELAALVASKVRSLLCCTLSASLKVKPPRPGAAAAGSPHRARAEPPPHSVAQPNHHSLNLQVFYHLGDLDDALSYALGAGSLFDVASTSEYVQTILGECSQLCGRRLALAGLAMLLRIIKRSRCASFFCSPLHRHVRGSAGAAGRGRRGQPRSPAGGHCGATV